MSSLVRTKTTILQEHQTFVLLEAAVSNYVRRQIPPQAEGKAPQILFKVAEAAVAFTRF